MTVPVLYVYVNASDILSGLRVATFTLANFVVNSNSCGTPHIPQQCVTYFRDVILTLGPLQIFTFSFEAFQFQAMCGLNPGLSNRCKRDKVLDPSLKILKNT